MTLAIALFNDRERHIVAVDVLSIDRLWWLVAALLLALAGLLVDLVLGVPVGTWGLWAALTGFGWTIGVLIGEVRG